jgi:hypothetical protein
MNSRRCRAALSVALVLASLATCVNETFALPANRYNLNNVIGPGSVSGFIETDGTIGVLTSLQIVDWNLVIFDGSSSFNLLGPASGANSELHISLSAAGFSATVNHLLFDFGGNTGGVLFQNPTIGSSINWYAMEDQANGIGTGVRGTQNLRVGFGEYTNSAVSTTVGIIATRVPEPAGWLLAATCVGGTAWARRRRRARSCAASAPSPRLVS